MFLSERLHEYFEITVKLVRQMAMITMKSGSDLDFSAISMKASLLDLCYLDWLGKSVLKPKPDYLLWRITQ